MFLTMMVIGLVGLVMMALPALGGHHLPALQGHGHGLGLGGSHGASHGVSSGAPAAHAHPTAIGGSDSIAPSAPFANQIMLAGAAAATATTTAAAAHAGRTFIPSPRAIFSVLALYGAFGNALVHAAHLTRTSAAVVAIVPALLVEWFLIRPVWNLLFRFRAAASSPLEELILAEAHAVVPFRNGQGMVATVRDGRRVQLRARLCDPDAALPVAFGQRLRIEDVDARRERVTVSVLPNDNVIKPTT